MYKVKLIAVSQENWESLRKFGEFGESYNAIITKILNKIDQLQISRQSELDSKEEKSHR